MSIAKVAGGLALGIGGFALAAGAAVRWDDAAAAERVAKGTAGSRDCDDVHRADRSAFGRLAVNEVGGFAAVAGGALLLGTGSLPVLGAALLGIGAGSMIGGLAHLNGPATHAYDAQQGLLDC